MEDAASKDFKKRLQGASAMQVSHSFNGCGFPPARGKHIGCISLKGTAAGVT